MTIEYRNKEENNTVQENDFLSLDPVERIYSFLNLMAKIKAFPTKQAGLSNDNFIIELTKSNR